MKFIAITFSLLCSLTMFSREIYVAKDGADTNSGTKENPYLTISRAASVAVAGDVVFIREGTYEETLTPANSGASGNPIIFQSYQNESVIISAMQTVNGFTPDSGSIYKTTLDWDLGQRLFVMNNNTPMDLARWPNNIDGDRFTLNSLRSDGGSDRDSPKSGHLLNSQIPNLPWENGGTLTFYGDRPGSGWLTWRFPISGSSNGRVNWTSTFPSNFDWIVRFHPPADGGDFFLEGIKEALDYQNEWYFNTTTRELFLQLPSGSAPEQNTIQVSRRENTININRKNYIEIRNLAVYGGSIIINGNNNKLFQVSSFYGAMTRGSNARNFATDIAAVFIGFGNFSNNTIEKCEIAYGDASGIFENGNGTVIKNNYIHDFGYLGNYDNPIRSRNGSSSKILNNTITRSGRDGINSINVNTEVAWNDVSHSNQIADDCALFYYSGPSNANNAAASPKNIEIHHNWFHDSEGRGKLRKAAGIYLDTNPNKFDVHHNVVWNVEWTAIQMNWNALDINVYNNTFMKAEGGAMGAWHLAGTEFQRVNVWNNVADEGRIDDPNTQEDEGTFEEQSDKRNNEITKVGFVDYNGNDFNLTASAQKLVDKGIEIPGFTDGFVSTAPDIGAYELGVPVWKPGVDWSILEGPAGRCYNIPGNICFDGTITSDNFRVQTTGETCPNSENGKITITSEVNIGFTAELKNEANSSLNRTVEFIGNLELDQLPQGDYNLCISKNTNEINLEQCYDLVVAGSTFIDVATSVNASAKELILGLSGSENYEVKLNGDTYFVSDKEEIIFTLEEGENNVEVKGDRICKGTFSKKIVLESSELLFYPNPIVSDLTIASSNLTIKQASIGIYSISGALLRTIEMKNQASLTVDLSSLSSGIYFASVDNGEKVKLIKQ